MRRRLAFVVAVAVCLLVAGCGENSIGNMKDTQWKMDMVQSGGQGEIQAVGSQMQAAYPEAETADLTCEFTETAFTLYDRDSGKSWEGTYRLLEREDDQTNIYDVTFDNKAKGNAVSSIKIYDDGTQEDVLILSVERYTIHFSR